MPEAFSVMIFAGRTTEGAGSPAPRRSLTGTSPGLAELAALVTKYAAATKAPRPGELCR